MWDFLINYSLYIYIERERETQVKGDFLSNPISHHGIISPKLIQLLNSQNFFALLWINSTISRYKKKYRWNAIIVKYKYNFSIIRYKKGIY